MKTIKDRLVTLVFYLSILFFIIGFNVNDTPPPSGWYQQFMPNLGGQSISDITFLDSLNGYAVTGIHYILRTTNAGNNWTIIYNDTTGDIFKKIRFLNQNTGFVCGGISENSIYYMLKTTNAGTNWFNINAPFQSVPQDDISILNDNTIWIVFSESLTGGVYRTTNGGVSWDRQLNLGSQNPTKIYMYNARIGFVSSTAGLYKTTDGTNWSNVSNDFSFSDMFFIDSLTGWKASGFMKKTTNGGLNWINQTLPSGGNIIVTSIEKFSNVNRDTIFGVSGYASTGLGARGMIYRTTNGGINWQFQIPDSNISIFRYLHIKFINKIIGWAYNPVTGVHTTTGGDPIFYTGIQEISYAVPEKFALKQNYPNPFNPRTVIPYSLSASAHVKIIAYDITGKEVQRMVDNYQHAGAYEVDFMGKFTASGVYFYRMTVDGEVVGTKKMILLK